MAGAAGADLFVGRLVDVAAAVAGDDGLHAVESLENGFAAPEATFAEGGGFELGGGGGGGSGFLWFARVVGGHGGGLQNGVRAGNRMQAV